MKHAPRQALIDILKQYGTAVILEPRKLRGLLNDFCGDHQTEIRTILYAVEEKIPEDLKNFSTRSSLDILLPRLVKRLTENRAVALEAAQWAVDSWLLALGLSSSVQTPELLPPSFTKTQTWIPSPEQEYEVWLQTYSSTSRPAESSFAVTNYKAGFFTDYLKKLIPLLEPYSKFKLWSISQRLCSFSMGQNRLDFDEHPLSPLTEKVTAVYSNLLSRGFPTLSSVLVEDTLAKSISEVFPIAALDSESVIQYKALPPGALPEEWVRSVIQAFVPVDPRSKGPINLPANNSPEKKYLFENLLPAVLPPPYAQFAHYDVIEDHNENDRIDCAFEWEGIRTGIKLVENQDQSKANSETVKYQGWKIRRISKEKIRNGSAREELLQLQAELEKNSFFIAAQENLNTPLWYTSMGRKALELVLAPFAVARIQKILLLALQTSKLRLDRSRWNLAVIERDIPCAVLAIVDFLDHLKALYDLMGVTHPLPEINVQVFHSPEFKEGNESFIHRLEERNVSFSRKPFSAQYSKLEQVDLCIDVAMLYRDLTDKATTELISQIIAGEPLIYSLRSNTVDEGHRQLFSMLPIEYPVSGKTDESLKFFLQNLFRKKDFRPGQIDIIKRAVSLSPVIGLLPTGAGKSICYQLPALLQPGVTMVVDPLRSLMLDQATNLKEQYLIDAVGLISSQFSAEEKEAVLAKLKAGQLQFIFVAPERLQNQAFRASLLELTSAFSIPFAVIDEAHCVSEWGHDFRTSYLNMAKTIQEHCVYRGKRPSVIALTGTASYSVLIDIQREVEVFDDEAIVLPPSFDREELEFGVFSVPTTQKWQKLAGLIRSLPSILHIPSEHFFSSNGEKTVSGIVFVPHVNGVFGVFDVAEKIKRELKVPVKIYSGSKPKKWQGNGDFEEEKERAQNDFKNNQVPVLVATKSFGMGIDKPNIRYTIHYNIPPSLEAFYQEVGRAGRDQKKAYCALIFSDDGSSDVNRALDPSSPIDAVRNLPETSFEETGDISRLFFFHGRAFRGEEDEYNKVIQVFLPIYQKLGRVRTGDKVLHKLYFNNSGSENGRDDLEKALYRLSVVGAIDDYTINYQSHCFEISAHRCDESDYVSNVKNYVARYKTPQEVEEVPQKIHAQPVNGIIYKCIRFLLAFIYQEIEKKRRAAIRTMVEVTRQAAVQADPNAFLRQEIIAYMKQTPLNELLLKLVKRMNSKEWWEILSWRNEDNCLLLESEEGARQLLGGCRRTLESYPDHPGLLFLSGIARLFLADQDVQESYNDLRAGLMILDKKNEIKKEVIAMELLDVLENKCGRVEFIDEVKAVIAKEVIHLFPSRDVARRMLMVLPNQATAVLLGRLARRLHEVNQTLKGDEANV